MDELARAQATLKQALHRARSSDDRELLSAIREQGEKLANSMGGLLKMGRIHAAGNRALDVPVAEVSKALGQMTQMLGAVHLVTVEDQVYVNDVRIRTEGVGGARELGNEIGKHDVGGVTFHSSLAEPLVRSLIESFAAQPAPQAPRAALQRALAKRGLGTVVLAGKFHFRTDAEQEKDPVAALRRALRLVSSAWSDLAAGRLLNPLPMRRSVVEMLGCGLDSPELWELPPDTKPHVAHSVQVTLTALLVGKACGLSAGAMQDLGVAALLHDIGYVLVSGPPAAALPPIQQHCGNGARLLLKQKGFHEAKVRRLRAILEHHQDYLGVAGAPSALGSILRVCEDYQNLVRLFATRVTRAAILGAMCGAAGKLYHRALPQLMVNGLGLHPPGTLLELADGRMVRSTCPVRAQTSFATPLARVLDPTSRKPTKELIDLAQGPPVRRVILG